MMIINHDEIDSLLDDQVSYSDKDVAGIPDDEVVTDQGNIDGNPNDIGKQK